MVFCLVGGGACAFLSLEGLGIPFPLVFLGAVVYLARRSALLPESLGVFGLGFTVIAARFVIPILANANGDLATSIYFSAILLAGPGLIAASIVLRRPTHWFGR
jgi:hypothetical protein